MCSKRSVNVVEHASQKQDLCPPPSPPQSKLSGAPGLRESQSSRASRARRHVGLGNEAEVGWTLFGPVPTETSDNIDRRGREGGGHRDISAQQRGVGVGCGGARRDTIRNREGLLV